MQDSIAKEKKWGKKMSGNFAIKGGGVGRLMANAILNFHFDYVPPSLGSDKNYFGLDNNYFGLDKNYFWVG